ncbi:MAG: TIGR03016 family PEP-CTERM system-associated outer membrane protein [Rubrivivax sp.]|nr:MAG: TIGR03016 family PEP-CTERM system-associated outer membrane protein [Rubrivivax sp.]
MPPVVTAMGMAMVTDTAMATVMAAAMTRRRAEPRCLAFAIAAWAALAHAQQANVPGPGSGSGSGSGTTIVPRVSLMQTWTDNLLLDDAHKDAALITTLSPGVRITSNHGVLRGTLDYALNGIGYLKSDRPSRFQNNLSADLRAELISGLFFVDTRASIGQQNASAFGQLSVPTLGSQGAVDNLANLNQRETGSLTISPSLRSSLGAFATSELRADFTRTEVRDSSLGDSRGSGGSWRITQRDPGLLAWWMEIRAQQTKSKLAASNSMQSARAGLSYRPDPDWYFNVNAGRERSNYLGNGAQGGATGGVSAEWTPTPRTRFGADWQRHDYGNSHGLNFEHRLSRTVIRFADTAMTTLGNSGAAGGLRTNYEQFFLLFASQEPDPVKRDALVRSYLLSQGLSPDAPLSGGFLSAGPSRLRSQQLSFAMQGVRGAVTASAVRSVTSRLGNNLNTGDLANTSQIEQRSYSLTASHQLTPQSGLSLTASRQETTGDFNGQAAKLSSVMVNWNLRFGPFVSGQLGARRSRFEGVIPYSENAAYANLTQQF